MKFTIEAISISNPSDVSVKHYGTSQTIEVSASNKTEALEKAHALHTRGAGGWKLRVSKAGSRVVAVADNGRGRYIAYT